MKHIILTFDVEEWFHTTFMTKYISPELLDQSRVELNIEFPLELLKKYDLPATFFILGELARSKPQVIRKIREADKDHEIASHSLEHELLYELEEDRIKKNIIESKKLIEDVSGTEVKGFRAPYFSINDFALETLLESGYSYDSSLHDFRLNPQYGHLTVKMNATKSPGIFTYNDFHEVTIPVKRYFNILKFPFGGGGYFRVYPLALQLYWIDSFLKSSDYFLMYMHPWEFDPGQPYIKDAPFLAKRRHYHGLASQYSKTEKMIKSLLAKGYKFITLAEYLNQMQLGARD